MNIERHEKEGGEDDAWRAVRFLLVKALIFMVLPLVAALVVVTLTL